jgi:hypothetical protein
LPLKYWNIQTGSDERFVMEMCEGLKISSSLVIFAA